MRRPSQFHAYLRFDTLEAREVPTVAALSGGVLTVTGTGQADTITVRQAATAITVDGVSGSFAKSAVDRIRIDAGGGGDHIKLDVAGAAVTRPAIIRAGSGDDVINGGLAGDYIDGEGGDDMVFGDAGNDQSAGDTGNDSLTGGSGNDSIAGGAGDDSISGGTGVDHMWGGDGYDLIAGGSGHDHVYDDFSLFAVHVDDNDYVHHHLGNADNSGFGWFDANLSDADLRRDARLAGRNGFIGRAELIGLFEKATDGNAVTVLEFHDLDWLVNQTDVTVAGQARYFGRKVMDGDPANQWFTGGADHREALGNLHAGDTGDHLQRLVDKWFLGKDLPAAKNGRRSFTYHYEAAAGRLFTGPGPSSSDVRQGNVGDCYWLASLGAVARKDPQRVRDMFTDNGDGTFTVRIYKNGHAEYVTVDTELPVNAGMFVFANHGRFANDPTNELWVALAEKAYAQANESGWLGQDGTNSYNGLGAEIADGADNPDGINGGFEETALHQITAANVVSRKPSTSTFAQVRGAFDAGQAITFGTPADPPNPGVVGDHAYMMVGYDATHHTITLRNPWGPGAGKPELITLTFADVQANFDVWSAAAI
jgi:Ca2+-binding RTX toxin-like protein